MNVLIFKAESGQLVADVPVNLRGANYQPQEREYLDEGWRCAVEDGLVNPHRRDDYRIELRTGDAS